MPVPGGSTGHGSPPGLHPQAIRQGRLELPLPRSPALPRQVMATPSQWPSSATVPTCDPWPLAHWWLPGELHLPNRGDSAFASAPLHAEPMRLLMALIPHQPLRLQSVRGTLDREGVRAGTGTRKAQGCLGRPRVCSDGRRRTKVARFRADRDPRDHQPVAHPNVAGMP